MIIKNYNYILKFKKIIHYNCLYNIRIEYSFQLLLLLFYLPHTCINDTIHLNKT